MPQRPSTRRLYLSESLIVATIEFLRSFWNDDDVARSARARQRGLRSNPAASFAAQTPPLTFAGGLVLARDMGSLDFYNEVLRPRALTEILAVNVHRDETTLTPVMLFRKRKQPLFDESARNAMLCLAPHLNRALRVTLRMQEMEARASALVEMSDRALTALSSLPTPSAALPKRTRLARVILGEVDGLLIRDGLLRAARGDDNARLTCLILEAAGGVDGLTFIRKSGVMTVGLVLPAAVHCRSSSRRPAMPPRPSAVRTQSQLPSPTRSGAGSRPGAARPPLWVHRARSSGRGAAPPRPVAGRSSGRTRDDREHGPHPHPPRLREDRRRAARRLVRLLMQGPGVGAR